MLLPQHLFGQNLSMFVREFDQFEEIDFKEFPQEIDC